MSAEVLAKLAVIEAKLDRLLGSSAKLEGGAPRIATDAELDDGKFGDPVVFKDPPSWKGDSFVGVPFSSCTPEYLDATAGFKDWCAQKDEESGKLAKNGKPAAQYGRLDAARARGWAKRIRANLSFPG